MARSDFENLRVHQLSEKLADEVWDIVVLWNDFAKKTVGVQLVKAADSVVANIAEGSGRGSYKDNRHFVRIARGSLKESQHLFRRAFKRNLLTNSQIANLKPIIDELAPKLNACLKSIGQKTTGN